MFYKHTTTVQDFTDGRDKSTSSSSSRNKAKGSMKKGLRVSQRQCNTGDTVGDDMRKRSGRLPGCKNKYNQ